MSRFSDFWESIGNRWCRLLTVSTGGFTTHNTGVMGSVVCMVTAFSRRIWVLFLIPCISCTPILEGKFLSKSAAYTRANTATLRSVFIGFAWCSEWTVAISVNIINQFIFVVKKCHVFFGVRTECLNTIETSFGFCTLYWRLWRQLKKIMETYGSCTLLYSVVLWCTTASNVLKLSIKPTALKLGKPRGLPYYIDCRTAV
jgi:hypothetical protein